MFIVPAVKISASQFQQNNNLPAFLLIYHDNQEGIIVKLIDTWIITMLSTKQFVLDLTSGDLDLGFFPFSRNNAAWLDLETQCT